MGERRKRKPQWDMDDEISGVSGHSSWAGKDRYSSRDSGRYHEFSEFRTTTLQKCRDHSEHQTWESTEETPISPTNDNFKNAREGKGMGEGDRYFERMSPGFDGVEVCIYDHPHDYDRSYSPRYRYAERARSRGRGRSRSRSRSRSLSKGRIIERRRGWSNNRSRSDGNSKYHSTSHSPVEDYQHQSYGWNDQSSPEKPSQVCRGFAAGRCNRGSQCRFVHPNSMSRRDDALLENDRAEHWRSKSDFIQPRGSYRRGSGFESQKEVSDCYHGEGELFVNRNRRKAPCKDFARGKCHWGDACRFSHHMNFDDGFGRGTKTAMFDKYNNRHPYKRRKPLCKYFAAGRCDRDNCRFSHDDPRLYNLESGPGEGTGFGSSRDKSNWWHGGRTRDEMVNSDTSSPPAWHENIVTNNITGHGDAGNGRNDDKRHHDFDNEEKELGTSKRSNSTLSSEKRPYFTGESGRYSTDTGPTEFIAEQNITGKQDRLILHDSGLVNQDGTDNVHEQRLMQENRTVPSNALQQNFFPSSHVQVKVYQTEENNVRNSHGPNFLGEVKETGYTSNRILLSGQSLNQSGGSIFGHSSISSESDGAQNMPSPTPSTRFSTDLNMPPICEVDNINSQTEMLNKQEIVQSPGPVERNAPQSIPSEQSDQLNNSLINTDGQLAYSLTTPASLSLRYEQQRTYAGAESVYDVDLQTEMQNKQRTVNSPRTGERNTPQLIPSEQLYQLNNSRISNDGRLAFPITTPDSSTQRYEQPQTYAGVNSIYDVHHLNLQTEMQNKQKTVNLPGSVERNAPQLIPCEQSDQLNNSLISSDGRLGYPITTPASSSQRSEQPQTYAGVDSIYDVERLNLQTDMQNKQKTGNSPGSVERNAPQLIPTEQSDQLNNSLINSDGRLAYPIITPVSSSQRYEQLRTYVGADSIYDVDLQTEIQNKQKTVNSPGTIERNAPQVSDQLNNSLISIEGRWVNRMTTPSSSTQRYEQPQTSLDLLGSMIRGNIEHDTHNLSPGLTDAQESQCAISLDLFSPVRSGRESIEHGNNNSGQKIIQTPNALENRGAISLDLFSPVRNGKESTEHDNHILAQEMARNNQMEFEQFSPISPTCPIVNHPESLGAARQENTDANSELARHNKAIDGESKDVQENKPQKGEESSDNKDEKGMRLFKKLLVEFIKEILKPTWKEGRMSKDVYKTVVKKVVDKVSGVISGDRVPTTKDKVDQYLSYSKPKITRLVQAYVDRCSKEDRGS